MIRFAKVSRPLLDVGMVGLMLVALGYQLTGNAWHELIGMLMFMAFMTHNLINYRWYRTVMQGKYPPIRIISIATNLLLLVDMLVLMATGILSSQTLFTTLPKTNHGFIIRQIHTTAAYWGLLIMSIHVGNHWQMIMAKIHFIAAHIRFWRLVAMAIVVYGVKASFTMQMGAKLIAYYSFSYWDFTTATTEFFLNYLAIMGLYICITHYSLAVIIANTQSQQACIRHCKNT